MNQKTLIVISKYNEDVSWTEKLIHPYIIYDKSEQLNGNAIKRLNIGREAETLLYYIITNYHSLPEITIFLQGDPRSNPVTYTYEQVIEQLNIEHSPELKTILTWEGNTDIKNYWLKSCAVLHSLLFEGDTVTKYSSGVQYVIPKDCITNRPIDLYILLYALVIKYGHKGLDGNKTKLNDGIDAWTMELIWGSIFNKNKILKQDYDTQLNKLLQDNS
jgi:hypothetical protein